MTEEKLVEAIENAGADVMLNLPCGRIKNLIEIGKKRIENIDIYREEEGIGISAGLWMAGKKPIMLIQGSGIGNSINALLSLTKCYEIPLPLLISWRGVYDEKIEAQKPLGKRLPRLLKAMDIPYKLYNGKNHQEIREHIEQAYKNNEVHAVLLRPDIWSKSPDNQFTRPKTPAKQKTYSEINPQKTRYQILNQIKEALKNNLVVSNIGIPSRELYHIQDQPTNFYMLGSLGLATPIGIGLTKTNRKTIVIDGDGSILMNPTSLFTAANQNTKNLKILAIDNASYGSTGCQKTTTKADLQMLAESAGLQTTRTNNPQKIKKQIKKEGKKFIHIPVQPGNKKTPIIPYNAKQIKKRFMSNIQNPKTQ
ncbi:sulfopyruvate decarboxylase subunit alpha [Methanonatronarchaeum sp. AMET-Sl]|uniref:sulfopyruvate decarboxylase subunit alpha n=1 Tax=Methanonatronarchaeum sp. AMET-Sl TaxID=3037654 RepID=UPI00244DE1AC|nr:sulfopyruvate decarboxylase subunit alpha [Methanonatronarchaeum sp. AMET-Sl]WGI18071.1 sulfopyruvate decarboxylase subunit alpha [Methanonatronarchaeum sp. AMET-Sl]